MNKVITKDTVLKQGNKSYPAIQTEQGIVWVDKDAEIKDYDYHISYLVDGRIKIYDNHTDWTHLDCPPIIAANFDLERVPKIELEDKVTKAIADVEECLGEAPIDFIGTGSDWRASEKEEKAWSKKWQNAVDKLKANQAKENENIRKAFIAGREHISVKGYTQVEFLNDVDVYLQSINSIKEIIVDENFKQI